jgi:hypothetical protein
MKSEKKDYANVAETSTRFAIFKQAIDERTIQPNAAILLWQAEFELMIAQQLTVIAGHLGRIVAAAQDAKDGE